jgi:hypothetical protein
MAPLPPQLEAHIAACAACAARAALWRELGPALAETAPEPPDALRARRMENAVMQRLFAEPLRADAGRRRRPWLAAAAGAAAALAVVAGLALVRRPPGAPAWGATLTRADGAVEREGSAVRAGERLRPGQTLLVAPAAAADLALDGTARLSLAGPARMALEGGPHAVVLRLDDGALTADVVHRAPTDTFWVTVRGGRVEVRGTRFRVTAGAAGATVEVQEGRVLVRDDAGREVLVGPGESTGVPLSPGPNSAAPETPAAAAGLAPPSASASAPRDCDELLRACQGSARKVRAALRSGEDERARHLLADDARAVRQAPAACAIRLVPCDDELRYLNAEMLQVQGRLEAAARAFRELDRPGAPPPTRQNALYAAARLEQRLGRAREASAEFERALDAAPRGALGEEALGGAMESAAAAGDDARAAALAHRYLAAFPDGLMARTARRLAAPDVRPR